MWPFKNLDDQASIVMHILPDILAITDFIIMFLYYLISIARLQTVVQQGTFKLSEIILKVF